MIKEFKYLSTFTGAGGFELAVSRVFPKAKCVGYSENDKFANQTYLNNFPDNEGLNIGDIERAIFEKNFKINKFRVSLLPNHNFLFGGPPCQGLSIARSNRQGLADIKSRLFFAFLAINQIKKPRWFLMENVASMSNESRDRISELLGVEAVKICVDRFTPQKRWRYYWFNWPFDISLLPKKGARWPKLVAWSSSNDYNDDGSHQRKRQRETRDGRANTLTTGSGCGSYSSKNYIDGRILIPRECEELQGLPVAWTYGVSNRQRYKQIGNSVNPDSIEAILAQHPWRLKR